MLTSELKTIGGGDQVALRGVRVLARLSGMSQRTIVEQMFVNRESKAIEAIYTFPLPDGAAVCGFEVYTCDRVLTGTIEESERAIDQYEHAIERGHGAYMVEADRPDVFTARVGNLKPKQFATIRLTYVAPLVRIDKQIRLTFPTAVAPRYASAMGMDPLEAIVEDDALNPPKALCVPYGLTLEVDVDLGRKIRAVTSPTHGIRVMPIEETDAKTQASAEESLASSRSLRVVLNGTSTPMDRDIVLAIDLAKEHEPVAELARGVDGAPYLAVSFVPEFDVDDLTHPAPTETIFVLDCSGSMQGESIDQATRALELCLRSLNPGDRFNICRFSSSFDMLASESLVYSGATLTRALRYISGNATGGGTEIMAPLEQIFGSAKSRRAGTGTRNIVLLTDGQVDNEHAVIELARKNRDHNRIFSFGIGAAASSFLVNGLARVTRGAAEFITGDERIEDKVLRTFGRIASPMIDDVEIDWGGADVQTLAQIPPVFDGDVLTVFGRVQGSPPKHVTLKCVADGQPKQWSMDIPFEYADGGVICTIWARRAIQSLEEVNDIRRIRVHPKTSENARVRNEIVKLSKQFNLLSSVTTFIAIEHRSLEERNGGRPALRRVPVMLAAGSGNEVRICGAGAAAPAMPCKSFMPAAGASFYDNGLLAEIDMDVRTTARRRASRMYDSLQDSKTDGPGTPRASDATLDRMLDEGEILQRYLSLQSADGWFDADDVRFDQLVEARAERQSVISAALPKLTSRALAERDRFIRTVMVLAILATRFADREAIWRRAARKARHWLAQQAGVVPGEIVDWLKSLEPALR